MVLKIYPVLTTYQFWCWALVHELIHWIHLNNSSMSCSVIHFRLCNPMDCSTPGFTISWSLLKLMCIESVMPSKHLILCHLLLILPSIFPSIRVFSNESVSFFVPAFLVDGCLAVGHDFGAPSRKAWASFYSAILRPIPASHISNLLGMCCSTDAS